MVEERQIKDLVYNLLIEPSRDKFRDFYLGNTGEKDNIDFKEKWNFEKGSLSKLLLSLGNSGGGIIVYGISENEDGTTDPKGIDKLQDNADIYNSIQKYVPIALKYQLYNFSYDQSDYAKLDGKKFQIIRVMDIPAALPYVSLADTNDFNKDTIYVRRGTKCEKAKGEELEKIINRRIETQYSSSSILNLEEHLNQLKVLYGQVEKMNEVVIEGQRSAVSKALFGLSLQFSFLKDKYEYVANSAYPEEDYEQFIVRLIKNKKIKVERVLDIR